MAIADLEETAKGTTIAADRKCTWQIRGVHSRSLLLRSARALERRRRGRGTPSLILV